MPGRIIKYRFDEETIKRLLVIEWWNWPYETLKENRHLFEVEINESTLAQMETIKQSIRN